MPTFDAHTHAFPDKVAAVAMPRLVAEAIWTELHPSHDGTLGGLLASMDRAGIDRAVLCSVATNPEQVRKITDWSMQIASDRVIPFASIHPDFPEPEAEVERIAEAGLHGLKFHPQYMNCPLDDPRTVRIARAAAEANLALTCHVGYDLAYEKEELGSPKRLLELHEAVPELRLLACHMGGWQRWDEVLTYLVDHPVYMETSYTLGQCPGETLEQLLDRHPPEFLLFGSDAPWADEAEELEKFRRLALPQEVKDHALWANAHRFAGLPIPDEPDTDGG